MGKTNLTADDCHSEATMSCWTRGVTVMGVGS